MEHACAHMLAGVGKGHSEMSDSTQVGRHVVGGDHDVDDLDHVQSIGKEQSPLEVICCGRAALAGLQVNGLSALTVGGVMRAASIKNHVAVRIAGAQSHHPRRLLQRPRDQFTRQAGPRAIVINRAARLLQYLQRSRRLVVNTHPLQQVEAVLMDALDIVAGQGGH